MEKLTNIKAIEMVLAMREVQGNSELVEKLESMKDSFVKKSANKKPTKTQAENNELINIILAEFERRNEPITLTELNSHEDLIAYSNQKLSALVKKLVDNGTVIRQEIKRKAYFMLSSKITVDKQ